MSPLNIGGPGSSVPFDSLSVPPAMRYTWPVTSDTGITAAVENGASDMAGVARNIWTLVNGPVHRYSTVAGARIARFGKSSIDADANNSMHNGSPSPTWGWPHLAQPVGSSGALPPHQRLWYFRASLALLSAAITLGNETGLRFRFNRTGVGFWAPETGNVDRHGFGLVGNGVGQWAWKSKIDDGGTLLPFDEVVNITWPIDVTEFAVVCFVVISATISQAAKVQLWVGDVLQLERSWAPDGGSNGILPVASGSPDNAGGLVVSVGCDGATSAGQELHMRDAEFASGAVHPITGEIFTGL